MSKEISERVNKYLTIRLRQIVYLLILFTSLILLFYGIWQVRPIIVAVEAPLGLASYLHIAYWIGLALVVLVSVFAFLDQALKKDALFILILLTLGLFLLGIRVFVEENALDADSYYPVSEVFNLLAVRHFDIANTSHIARYYSWPAFHFISATLLEVTGLKLITLMKYTPLYSILFFVLITYGIGKRLSLPPNSCFLLGFLAISSWLIAFNGFYYPRLMAATFFLLLFMLLVLPDRTISRRITLLILFSALVLTHGFVTVLVILGVLALSIYRKEINLVTVFIAIFAVWYMYQSYGGMETGIRALEKPLRDIFELARMERYETASPMGRLIARYSQLTYLLIYGTLIIGSIFLILRKKITGKRRHQIIALYVWIMGVGLTVAGSFGQDVTRTYAFSIVQLACIVILSNFSKKLLIPVMCIFVILSPMVNYASLAVFGQVTSSALSGARFFALKVKPQESIFAVFNTKLPLFYDPDLIMVNTASYKYATKWMVGGDVSQIDKYRYVVFNKLASDELRFQFGKDQFLIWPQTVIGSKSDLIYNNGFLQIYENHVLKQE